LEAARIETLYKQGWATAGRAEAAQASSRAADAAVRSRRFSLQTARIIAPGSGVILARTAEPDQVVAAASPVLVLGEADRGFVLRVPLNDRAAARIAPGGAARVTLDALGSAPIAGRVVEIGGRAAQATGTFDAKIALPADPRIRSGMIGTAHIATSAPGTASRIVLPADAVLSPRAGEALVYVVASGKARLRTVRIGDTTDDGVEIIDGLAAGERVALSGFERLRDGLAVRSSAPAR
jgi:membrane fusion protein (multidrug efflux system)